MWQVSSTPFFVTKATECAYCQCLYLINYALSCDCSILMLKKENDKFELQSYNVFLEVSKSVSSAIILTVDGIACKMLIKPSWVAYLDSRCFKYPKVVQYLTSYQDLS